MHFALTDQQQIKSVSATILYFLKKSHSEIMHIYAYRRTTYKNVSRRSAVRFQDHNVIGLNKIRQRLDRLRDVPGGQERDQGARVAHNDDHGYHHPAANQGHFTPVGKPFG